MAFVSYRRLVRLLVCSCHWHLISKLRSLTSANDIISGTEAREARSKVLVVINTKLLVAVFISIYY